MNLVSQNDEYVTIFETENNGYPPYILKKKNKAIKNYIRFLYKF